MARPSPSRIVSRSVLLLVALFLTVSPNQAPPASAQGQLPSFTAVGSMASARYHHTAALLPSNKVLITGGNES